MCGSTNGLSPVWRHPRYTVDTPADLEFARAVAARLPGQAPPAHLATLEAILADDPGLAEMNAAIVQRGHREAEQAQRSPAEES